MKRGGGKCVSVDHLVWLVLWAIQRLFGGWYKGRNQLGVERGQLVVKSASQCCRIFYLRWRDFFCMRIYEASLAGCHKFFIGFLVDLKFCPF